MAPTVKVWNLPKLRCNCSSDISCSPSLVWSHGRAAGSLPHPAPSPSIVLCSSVTLLWDQFTGVDWLPCPSSLRPIASCACAHPTSAWLILIAVIQSGNLLQPWGDINDIAQTSGVQRNRKSNFSKSLTMNFLLMFNSRQNRHYHGELASCWLTSKAGVNSDFVFILKRITASQTGLYFQYLPEWILKN